MSVESRLRTELLPGRAEIPLSVGRVSPFWSPSMTLTPEQRQAVAGWIAAGETLAAVQRRLADEFKLSLTYMEVRFLVDDLGLELTSPEPPKPRPASTIAPAEGGGGQGGEKKGLFGKLKEAVSGRKQELPTNDDDLTDEDIPADDLPLADDDVGAPAASGVKLEVDRITRPGTLASGTVLFSDGVKARWGLDQFGRLMLDADNKGYRPSAADLQSFQVELQTQLARLGY
jgi:hypothetical protein